MLVLLIFVNVGFINFVWFLVKIKFLIDVLYLNWVKIISVKNK